MLDIFTRDLVDNVLFGEKARFHAQEVRRVLENIEGVTVHLIYKNVGGKLTAVICVTAKLYRPVHEALTKADIQTVDEEAGPYREGEYTKYTRVRFYIKAN